MLDQFDLSPLVAPAMDWFYENKRDLPWRKDRDPYHIWVSEIMLQQTRVEAVKPYYTGFLTALPTIADLAACPKDRLNKLWEGLGYYSRVRNMQRAAGILVEEYGGRMPEDYESILSLPGIGPYTAGAIASIAFDLPRPAVDGNVLRILARVSGDDIDIKSDLAKKRAREALNAVMPEKGSGIFNQALMEIGATVCLPAGRPLCGQCPWRGKCLAEREGSWDRLPVRSKGRPRRVEERTVLIVRNGSRVVIGRRPEDGLLAGLYEFPNVRGHLSEDAALARTEQMGYEPLHIRRLDEARHIFSHIEWRMIGYEIRVSDGQLYRGEDDSEARGDAKENGPEARGDAKKNGPEIRGDAEENGSGKGTEKAMTWPVDIEEISRNYAIPSAFAAYADAVRLERGPKIAGEKD